MATNKGEYKESTLEQRRSEVQHDRFSIKVSVPSGFLPSKFGLREEKPDVEVFLGYRRALEFDEKDLPGQDFVTVRGGDGYVVGVVTDGVSQSFYGDRAAKYLSPKLLERLWETRENPPPEADLEGELRELERVFAKEVERLTKTLDAVLR